jgi:MarR family transcriptional regulator, organic hydroperoxide resistance regulator
VKASLGTQLRHLLELLDGDVSAAYEEAGLNYRPRYTPVMRTLMQHEASTIGQVAERAGITQPAATQTVALMIKEGLLTCEAGATDGRQKMIRLSEQGKALLPHLQKCWNATAAAARGLDEELPFALSKALDSAITALEAKPFGVRIREMRAAQAEDD